MYLFIDCIRLLLQLNADPRVEDEDGTTPMELAKDDATRALLHDAVIDTDSKRDAVGRIVFYCISVSLTELSPLFFNVAVLSI